MANPNIDTLNKLAEDRLKEAKLLLANEHFSGAAYLGGYAIELKLKSKICQRLNWSEYPPAKISKNDCLKVHDLRGLTYFAGIRDYDANSALFIPEPRVLTADQLEIVYHTVIKWSEVKRYEETKPKDARNLLDAIQKFFDYLNE
jgi:hypothetical protein